MMHLEIKIRGANDKRFWKNIPLWVSGRYDKESLDSWLESYCKAYTEDRQMSVIELRWNYVGSPQGHYYTPKPVVSK